MTTQEVKNNRKARILLDELSSKERKRNNGYAPF